jgi:hypothetical protein
VPNDAVTRDSSFLCDGTPGNRKKRKRNGLPTPDRDWPRRERMLSLACTGKSACATASKPSGSRSRLPGCRGIPRLPVVARDADPNRIVSFQRATGSRRESGHHVRYVAGPKTAPTHAKRFCDSQSRVESTYARVRTRILRVNGSVCEVLIGRPPGDSTRHRVGSNHRSDGGSGDMTPRNSA